MLVMLKLECKNVNYENEINICLEFLYDNNYGTPCRVIRYADSEYNIVNNM